MPIAVKMRFGFDTFVVLLFLYTGVVANGFNGMARPFPVFVSIAGVMLGLGNLASDLRRHRSGKAVLGRSMEATAVIGNVETEVGDDRRAILASLGNIGVLLGYLAGVALVGLYPATIVFLVLFARYGAKRSWQASIVVTAITFALFYGLIQGLDLTLPRSYLL